jgi:hypothetical protein
MDFIDQIKSISALVSRQMDSVLTEEATKSALLMPFIQALGYNVFDITEVVPEYDANVGASRKYKLDYAILKNGEPIIIIECKHHKERLDSSAYSQLSHYFNSTSARIGVLTNGISYQFYSDLEKPNKLDEKPFLEIDMLSLQEPLISELKKITKSAFNIDEIITTASELKYTREIKRILAEQFNSPSEEFVKFFAKQIYNGAFSGGIKQKLTELVKRSFHQFIREKISEILETATKDTEVKPQESIPVVEVIEETTLIETTQEELEAFYIVKSILSQSIDVKRVVYRDTLNYFNILLDNNKLKPICRLYLNSQGNKRVGLFDHSDNGKTEEKISIEDVNDLYRHSERLKNTVSYYENSYAKK